MANFNEQTAQRLAKGREIYRTKVSLYDPDFSATDTKYGFPPGLMRAVALVESDWNADAKNPESGARGIMQITPRTAKQLNVDPLVSRQAIDAAGKHIRELINKYGGRVDLALAAYNGGPSNVDNWVKTGIWSNSKSERPLQNAAYPHLVLGVMGYDYPLNISSPKVGEDFKFKSTSETQTPILPTKGTPFTVPLIKDDGTDQYYIGGKTRHLPKTVSQPFPSGHVSKAFVDNPPTDNSPKTPPTILSPESVNSSVSTTTPDLKATVPKISGLDPALNPSLVGLDPYQLIPGPIGKQQIIPETNTLDTTQTRQELPPLFYQPFTYKEPVTTEPTDKLLQTNSGYLQQALNPFFGLNYNNMLPMIQNWWA